MERDERICREMGLCSIVLVGVQPHETRKGSCLTTLIPICHCGNLKALNREGAPVVAGRIWELLSQFEVPKERERETAKNILSGA